ncbi:MAG: cytochrome c-type biogenesis protein CcmH [Anaerolineae bacterium]|nr:cytochrome c-type biogenesis protein CcmH [Anaerolineae bacterium]
MNRLKNFLKFIITIAITTSLLLTSSFLLPPFAQAQEEPDFDRINDIAKKLNCPTCTGINLSDCRTQTCEQWRNQIDELVSEGYSEQEVLDYFSARYGDQVLQEPPRRGFSLALWVLPAIALAAGGIWLVNTLRGWRKQQPGAVATTTPHSTKPTPPALPADYLSLVEKDLERDET